MSISRSIIHQTLAITPVTFGNFMTGSVFGWLAPTLQTYKNSNNEFSLTDDDCSRIVSLQYLGRILGCVFAAATVDRFGRSAIISLAAIFMTVSWTCTALTKVVLLHYAIRFIFGMSLGMTNTTTPMYVGEISSPRVRGVFGSISLIYFFSGQFLGCILATYCTYELVTQIMAGISLVNLASVVLLREPAQHLLARGHETKAQRQFLWLRGDDEKVRREFTEMKAKSQADDNRTAFSLAYLLDRRFQIVCALNSLAFLTGFPVLISLISIALSPTERFSSNELTILFELAQLIGAIVSPWIIDRFNRRTLWIVASTLTIVSHLTTAALYYAHETGVHIVCYSWLLFASITAYSTIFSTVTYALSTTARGEFLPQKFKAFASCTSLLLNSMLGSLLGHMFLSITTKFGMKMNFINFAAGSLLLLLFCYFCVPETKGMSLVDIEKYFEKSKKKKLSSSNNQLCE